MSGRVITEIIIGKGNIIGGIVFIAFFLGLVLMLSLVVYRESLLEATGKHTLPDTKTPLPEAATRQLPDPYRTGPKHNRTNNRTTFDKGKTRREGV